MTDPEPRRTPGRRPEDPAPSGVPPGETPPGEGSTSAELGHREPPELRRAWGPVPMALILAFAIIMAILFAAMGVTYLLI